MTNREKLEFLKRDFIACLKKLKGNEKPVWGVMDAQQMIEHMGEAFIAATGALNLNLMAPIEKVEAMLAFVMSEKEFKPNTKNVLMGETPAPHKFASMEEAVLKLEKAVLRFEKHYQTHQEKKEMNPFFGPLNFEQQTQLLHKHAMHHLKQFELI